MNTFGNAAYVLSFTPLFIQLKKTLFLNITFLWKDTQHQSYEGQKGHEESEVGHVVLSLCFGQSVRQRRLQAHKQHAGGKGDARSDIVENFGIIHLPGDRVERLYHHG